MLVNGLVIDENYFQNAPTCHATENDFYNQINEMVTHKLSRFMRKPDFQVSDQV